LLTCDFTCYITFSHYIPIVSSRSTSYWYHVIISSNVLTLLLSKICLLFCHNNNNNYIISWTIYRLMVSEIKTVLDCINIYRLSGEWRMTTHVHYLMSITTAGFFPEIVNNNDELFSYLLKLYLYILKNNYLLNICIAIHYSLLGK
jgi:hypothetical protein